MYCWSSIHSGLWWQFTVQFSKWIDIAFKCCCIHQYFRVNSMNLTRYLSLEPWVKLFSNENSYVLYYDVRNITAYAGDEYSNDLLFNIWILSHSNSIIIIICAHLLARKKCRIRDEAHQCAQRTHHDHNTRDQYHLGFIIFLQHQLSKNSTTTTSNYIYHHHYIYILPLY